MSRHPQPPINPPSTARALKHALIIVLAVAYIGAAAMQLVRDEALYAAGDLLIAALLGLLLNRANRRNGRVLANFGTRRVVKHSREERWCAWCGESIAVGARAVQHSGAHEGKPYAYQHHPECDLASAGWVAEQRTERLIAHPKPGSMERGGAQSRDYL